MQQTIHTREGGPYDASYASLYDDIWSKNPIWQDEVKFHIQEISRRLTPASQWLDVGCGTGYLLSQFPQHNRIGLDFSPHMLAVAKRQNPKVDFIEQSIIDDNPSLENRFDLVTCTGQPWSYLPSFDAIEKAAAHLAAWTAVGGTCMLTPIDISDMMENQLPKFYDLSNVPSEYSFIRGIWWTYKEQGTVYHNCLLPNIDEWVRWFSNHFRKVEVITWPHEPAYLISPKRAIVCSEKREAGDQCPATIVVHPVPPKPAAPQSPLSQVSHKHLLLELGARVKTGSLLKAGLRKLFRNRS